MPRLEEREYTYFTTVRSLCGRCRGSVPARVFFRAGQVWQQALCPKCASPPCLIAGDEAWYVRETLRTFASSAPIAGAHAPEKGCPQDCGPCSWHASPCRSVEVSASAPEDAGRAAEAVVGRPGGVARLYIQTTSANAVAVARACARLEIGRLILRSAPVESAHELAASGVHVSVSLDGEVAGAAVENFTRAGVGVELEAPIGEAACGLELVRASERITSLVVTAKGVPADEAAKLVCKQSGGEISFSDFHAEAHAHPLCRLTCDYGRPPRPVTVHALMDGCNFDCCRAMLCPDWALIRPGVMAPACMAGFDFLHGER